jgi:HNH endonuclease
MNRTDFARLVLSDPSRAREEAQRIVKAADGRKRGPVKTPNATAKRMDENKSSAEAARRAELDRIIPTIQKRSGGACEWCSGAGHHFHHMLPGSQRRKRESVESMVLLCTVCHDRYHASYRITLWHAEAWAQLHSTPEVLEEVRRRLAKVERTRRAAS